MKSVFDLDLAWPSLKLSSLQALASNHDRLGRELPEPFSLIVAILISKPTLARHQAGYPYKYPPDARRHAPSVVELCDATRRTDRSAHRLEVRLDCHPDVERHLRNILLRQSFEHSANLVWKTGLPYRELKVKL